MPGYVSDGQSFCSCAKRLDKNALFRTFWCAYAQGKCDFEVDTTQNNWAWHLPANLFRVAVPAKIFGLTLILDFLRPLPFAHFAASATGSAHALTIRRAPIRRITFDARLVGDDARIVPRVDVSIRPYTGFVAP